MRKTDGRLIGILGTVIIHLIAGIIFISFKIKSLDKINRNEFLFEYTPEEVAEVKEKLLEIPVTDLERILQDDPEMLNIARNLSGKSDPEIDADDYIDMVKEELIKSGKLGADNYIDAQKKATENVNDESLAIAGDSSVMEEKVKPRESNEPPKNYKGPTRIYYDLTGRTHIYLPIPIYMCQGSGKVVLSIEINQKGEVEKAQIIEAQSTTSDICLIETAVATALVSRFNPDVKSPRIQIGTLTYHFVAQ